MVRPYGSAEHDPIDLVEAYDLIEPEYAALRKHAVMLDQPQRGTLEVRGGDRIAFLNRMLTQELKGLAPFHVRRSYWLNRKGRIDADMRLIELPDRMLIDLDYFSTIAMGERQAATESLGAYVFSEDVQIDDQTARWHRLALHGPAALALLARSSAPVAGPAVLELASNGACVVSVAGHEVIVDRFDSTGEIGLELLMAVDAAEAVYAALSVAPDVTTREAGEGWKPDASGLARRVGWHAYNIARIEAGTPLFFIDFGPTSLPHETGDETLNDRVSFKKGCYLGQEVVARMQSLGHPKQRLVALRLAQAADDAMAGALAPSAGASDDRTPDPPPVAVPSTGCAVLHVENDKSDIVGAVTSATHAPMLGGAAVCFAMVKYKHTTPGTKLLVEPEEGSPAPLQADVQPSLRFWKR